MNYKPIQKSNPRQRVIPYGLPIYNSDVVQEAGFNLDELQVYYPMSRRIPFTSKNVQANFWRAISTIGFKVLLEGTASAIFTPGKLGLTPDFNGVIYYRSQTSLSTMLLGNIDFTVGCWAKVTDKTLDGLFFAFINNTVQTLASNLAQVAYQQSTDRFRFFVGDGAGVSDFIDADALGSPTLGTFYFIVCRHFKDGNIQITINNTLSNSKVPAVRPTNITLKLNVGGSALEGSKLLIGKVEEIFWFNRILSNNEIEYLYNDGNGRILLN